MNVNVSVNRVRFDVLCIYRHTESVWQLIRVAKEIRPGRCAKQRHRDAVQTWMREQKARHEEFIPRAFYTPNKYSHCIKI